MAEEDRVRKREQRYMYHQQRQQILYQQQPVYQQQQQVYQQQYQPVGGGQQQFVQPQQFQPQQYQPAVYAQLAPGVVVANRGQTVVIHQQAAPSAPPIY